MAVRLGSGGLQSYESEFEKLMRKSKKKSSGGTATATPPKKDVLTGPPEILRNADTGKVTGVKVGGKTYANIGKKEALGLVENWNKKQEGLAGTIEGADMQEALAKQQQADLLAGQVGNVGEMSAERLAELQGLVSPQSQFAEGLPGALREGTISGVSKGITYGAGALGASAITGGAAAPLIPIAVAGGIIQGYWGALAGARKSEAKEDADNIMAEYAVLKRGMSNVAQMAVSNQMNPEEGVELFNQQYSRMLELQAQLKYLTDTDLKDYLSDGGGKYIAVTTYINEVVPAYRARLQTGLTNPLASTIPYSDVFTEETIE